MTKFFPLCALALALAVPAHAFTPPPPAPTSTTIAIPSSEVIQSISYIALRVTEVCGPCTEQAGAGPVL